MNENPEGTPNPLNPNPVDPGATPMPEPITETAPQTPVSEPIAEAALQTPTPELVNQMPAEPVAPESSAQPTTMQTTEVTEPVSESVPVNVTPSAPEVEPKDSIVEPAVKKKSGKKVAIVLAILFLLIAIGCGVAAFLIAKPFGGKDAVPAAISKLLRGAPDTAVIDGSIIAEPGGSASPASNITVNFKAGFNNISGENYANSEVSATLGEDENFSFKADEIHTGDGVLYLKLNGISDALSQYYSWGLTSEPEPSHIEDCVTDDYDCINVIEEKTLDTEINCAYDLTGMTNCTSIDDTEELYTVDDIVSDSIFSSLGLISFIDDEWIMIPDSDFSNLTGLIGSDIPAQCLIDAAGNLGEYGNNFADMYEKNPFVTYSTDNITIAKKKNTIYHLGFDAEKMAGFINEMGDSGFINELNACMGYIASNKDVKAEDLTEIIAKLPDIYVEIDNNDNFTRVYMELETGDDCDDCVYIVAPTTTKITADLSFNYPDSITIEEPDDYLNITDVISQVLGQFYGTDFGQPEWIDCQPPLSETEAAICEEAEASGYPYIAY